MDAPSLQRFLEPDSSALVVGLATLLVFGAGFCLFWVGWSLISRSAFVYHARFITGVGEQLRSNFVDAAPAPLLMFSVALSASLFAGVGLLLDWPMGVAACLLALAAPRVGLIVVRRRRVRAFVQQLPDALQSMASALRAGSNLTKSLEFLATRQPAPLSQEFALVLAKHRLGHELGEALAELRRRVPRHEVDLFNSAVTISSRIGGNLAETIDSLAQTLREKAQVEGKIASLTAMGRMQGWVLCLLPLAIGGVLFLQQPERMRLLFTEIYGWAVLATVAVMMAAAIWMIRRIVAIDV